MSTSTATAEAADVLKLFVQLPTRALAKRYQKAAGCDKEHAGRMCVFYSGSI